MAFVKRKIDVDFVLGKGAFGESGADTVTLTGHRVSVDIVNVIGPGKGNAEVRLWGLKRDLLMHLSSLNQATEAVRKNRLVVRAGDDLMGMATVFDGTIFVSQFCANAQPEAYLRIAGYAGLYEAVKPTAGLSFKGAASAAVVMQNIAQVAGAGFQNYGVNATLQTPALHGSAWEMMDAVCKAANANYVFEDNSFIVWPKNGARGGQLPLISSSTGMVGYPDYASAVEGRAVDVRTLFNPNIRLGGKVKLESDLQVASGDWTTTRVSHELDAELPNGHWYTRFEGLAPNDR